MWINIPYISNKTKMVYIYIKCIRLHILTKDWPWCNGIHFLKKQEYPKSFFIISVYRYNSMVKSLLIRCNGIHLLTHTLHLLIVCHSKNCEVHLISSWKQKVSTKSFWLTSNSKHFVLVAKLLILIPAALKLLDFLKKWLKRLSVFQTMILTLYNLWYSFWHGLANIINRFYGVA